jgi:hypothetical protein
MQDAARSSAIATVRDACGNVRATRDHESRAGVATIAPSPAVAYARPVDHPEAVVSQSGSEGVEERIARLEQQDERLTRALELLARHEAAPVAKPGRDWNACTAIIASCIGILV